MLMTTGIRFTIYFGLSFFILSLPIQQRPIFYYLYNFTASSIHKVTGMSGYVPTYRIDSESQALQEASMKAFTDQTSMQQAGNKKNSR